MTAKPRVLHVIKYLEKKRGGMPYAITNIITLETQELDFDSDVMSISDQERNLELEEKANRIYQFPSFLKVFYPSSWNWFWRNYRNYEIIHFHGVWNSFILFLLIISYLRGVNCTLWPHCSLDRHDMKKKRAFKQIIGKILISRIIPTIKSVIVTTQKEFDNSIFFTEKVNYDELALPVYHREVDGHEIDFEIPDNKFVFIFLSRFDPKKGLMELIDAFSRLQKVAPDCFLILAGSDDSDYSKEVLKHAENCIDDENLLIPGYLDEFQKQSIFKSSDCFVLPSKYENFGISVVEALHFGLPVLITENVYIHDMLNESGAVFSCGEDSESIFQTLRKIIDHPEVFENRRKRAKVAAHSFSPEVMSKKYQQLYNRLLG